MSADPAGVRTPFLVARPFGRFVAEFGPFRRTEVQGADRMGFSFRQRVLGAWRADRMQIAFRQRPHARGTKRIYVPTRI